MKNAFPSFFRSFLSLHQHEQLHSKTPRISPWVIFPHEPGGSAAVASSRVSNCQSHLECKPNGSKRANMKIIKIDNKTIEYNIMTYKKWNKNGIQQRNRQQRSTPADLWNPPLGSIRCPRLQQPSLSQWRIPGNKHLICKEETTWKRDATISRCRT